ncbi:hypothetical protein DL93DRAFT_2127334 [Clavulina sp. PMI_390]|nr:hypothetical protein DL93DRAFT_2127334 [Clavulina sp. PMI_390]
MSNLDSQRSSQDSSSIARDTADTHAVTEVEAISYHASFPSRPRLLYRTGKAWSPPRGPDAHGRRKMLYPVFNHPIVVGIMGTHKVIFTTIDVVRFKMFEFEDTSSKDCPDIGPVTIWIGVVPDSTTATTAQDAAQVILALLKDYGITDVDVDFRESRYIHAVGPQLFGPVIRVDPLVDVIGPLTPTLGLGISTTTSPAVEGTMALYLAEGGDSDKLLGLTCRHVLFGRKEANVDFVHYPGGRTVDVVLLGERAFKDFTGSIQLKIEDRAISAELYRRSIKERERTRGTTDEAEKAQENRRLKQACLNKEEEAVRSLGAFLAVVNAEWKEPEDRVLGPIRHSPAIRRGVGERRFTEDWGIFEVDRAKLGDGFRGNKIDLGSKITPGEFVRKCFPRGDGDWRFEYPIYGQLALSGTLTDDLMRDPDMWGPNGEPCLLVIKSGNTTGATIGRANGVLSVVRNYADENMEIYDTSMEWAIMDYDKDSGGFSAPGDSGAIIADIRGRIGGMITGGCGKGETFDLTYATPFWWLLERIRANGFPNVHLNVFEDSL